MRASESLRSLSGHFKSHNPTSRVCLRASADLAPSEGAVSVRLSPPTKVDRHLRALGAAVATAVESLESRRMFDAVSLELAQPAITEPAPALGAFGNYVVTRGDLILVGRPNANGGAGD